ncbi:MAG: T9SS type A sorting domain-containing protein [Balneola sp.]
MKKLLILLLLFPISLTAQEKYFHELKGMEDSTGTTHLFYRMYEETSFQCSEANDSYVAKGKNNNIHHFDTSILSDSIAIRSGWSEWCIPGIYDGTSVRSYTFLNNDPKKRIYNSSWECYNSLESFSEKYFPFYFSCFIKRNPMSRNIQWDQYGIHQENDKNSILVYSITVDSYVRLPSGPENWPFFEEKDYEGYEDGSGDYFDFIDSIKIGFDLLAIHPIVDSMYYAKSISDSLKASSFEVIIPSLNTSTLRFDSSPSIVYALHFDTTRKLSKSEDYGRNDSWISLNLPSSLGLLQFVETDPGDSGELLISDSSSIYLSNNFGVSFDQLVVFDYTIKGLYKKPNSDVLYVLTTDELFEVNTETKAVTSLKKLPVSNEEPKETPSSIKLHQNYPNPFNPTTTISFELDKPENVTLTIFDALGRMMTVLVDKQLTTGVHEMSFDASTLSSGIYFYRLDAGAFSEIKRFTLIK